VESSCEFGIKLSGSIKCWETIEWPHNLWVVLSSIELVSYPKECVSYFKNLALKLKPPAMDLFMYRYILPPECFETRDSYLCMLVRLTYNEDFFS
jgi:hypothetical protein